MKHLSPLLCIILIACLAEQGCKPEDTTQTAEPVLHLIPKPQVMQFSGGTYEMRTGLVSAPQELQNEAAFLIGLLKGKTSMTAQQTAYGNKDAQVFLELDPGKVEEEGYQLVVSAEGVTIKGGSPAGVFYGVQTFRQMIPLSRGSKPSVLALPFIEITDAPEFRYRGMHLDVSRHFHGVEVVKRYLDVMARYKMNRFHWHLTDDQGWRIPIDAYPKLNTISSWRDETLVGHYNDLPWRYDGKRHGGYYTKDQIRDIVAYARALHITVIPEVEMPGHSQAVLAAYPEFGCTGETIGVRKVWGISEHVLCPKEETFAFIEAVLTEVMDLFPGEYIHIGGDECPKTQWEQSTYCQDLMQREGLQDEMELQSWFVRRIETFLTARGRTLIGWDEILEGGLAPNATVMSWRGTEGGIEAAKQGHDVIMTPTSHMYFDYYQSTSMHEPPAIGGYLPLEKVYSFEPVPEALNAEEQKHILGAQGNVWTEYINSALKLDYMAWPRGIALAEVVWSDTTNRDFTDFAQRLEHHLDVLRGDGIYAANHLYDLDYYTKTENGELILGFEKILPDIVVLYSLNNEKSWSPTAGELKVDSSMTVVARAESRKGVSERSIKVTIEKHLAAGKPVTLANVPAPRYSQGGIQSIVNGIRGSDTRFGDREWLGFEGTDCIATIDLGENRAIREIATRCFQAPGQWIYLPASIEIELSPDGVSFTPAGQMQMSEEPSAGGPVTYVLNPDDASARYVRLKASNFGDIPEGAQGAGHKAWLFVDEIAVRD